MNKWSKEWKLKASVWFLDGIIRTHRVMLYIVRHQCFDVETNCQEKEKLENNDIGRRLSKNTQ